MRPLIWICVAVYTVAMASVGYAAHRIVVGFGVASGLVTIGSMCAATCYCEYVKLNTSPSGGNLQVIREYFFQLCRAAGKAPYSSECDMWSPVEANLQFPQGTYRYLARWANGSDECARVVLVNSGADVDKVETKTIRQTGNVCSK
jgi:hypothetical protein